MEGPGQNQRNRAAGNDRQTGHLVQGGRLVGVPGHDDGTDDSLGHGAIMPPNPYQIVNAN